MVEGQDDKKELPLNEAPAIETPGVKKFVIPIIGIAPGAPARKVVQPGRESVATFLLDDKDSLAIAVGRHAISAVYAQEIGTACDPLEEK